jgi:hypothetical protein
MVWTAGFETANGSGNIVYAQHLNHLIMAMRGNYVLDPTAGGLAVTANSSSNLGTSQVDVDIADGVCFNNSTRRNLTSIASIDLSTEYSGLSSGQSRFVFIYVNSSGSVAKVAGTAATTGNQLPPDVPESSVILAMVTLTNGDTTVDSADIEDWRIEAPQGMLTNDDIYLNGNDIQLSDGSQITEAEINLLDGLTGTVWTSANDGAGSGLDADTLDGNQGSSYASLSGATFTGAVTINDFSANYDTTALSGTVTLNDGNFKYSNEVTLISYTASDVNRILFSHRKFRVYTTNSPGMTYDYGTNNTRDTEGAVFQLEVSVNGSTYTKTITSGQITTSSDNDTDFGPTWGTNYIEFDGDELTGDVKVKMGVKDGSVGGSDAVDDTINFGAGDSVPNVWWVTAFKTP